MHLNLVLNCKTEKLKSFMRVYIDLSRDIMENPTQKKLETEMEIGVGEWFLWRAVKFPQNWHMEFPRPRLLEA